MVCPIINPDSEKLLKLIIKKLPHALLLTGENKVGLSTIAKHIAAMRSVSPQIILPENDEKIDIKKGIISIDIMRRLYDETRTKTAGERIIIIDYAERMTIQAQNAFLKLLEEPGEGVHFILVSHSISKLLPTIISRTEHLNIKPISSKQSSELLDTLDIKDNKKRSQMLFIAEGLPAELTILASDIEYFEMRSTMIRDARELLSGNLYRKLLITQRYKDNRTLALLLLIDASNILKKTIFENPKLDTINYIDKLLKTYERIEANGNIRLCLAQMII